MIEHNPPPVPPGYRKEILFWNKGKDSIRIQHLRFQSDIHPRQWDTLGDELVLDEGQSYLLPVVGTGEVFIKWQTTAENRADHFVVQFDEAGNPYPYIFGGDRWTMALRHAALRAMDNGDA